jgi:alkanesulfonate monooxygenase SsuD/methylene tetrahydromethanopterin reductase-like flavin-dependent oxidoreductase (luciferase family)
VRFAISIPQHVADGTFDPDGFRAYLGRAEELGFHSGWTQEQVLGTIPHLGPAELLSYAAACTERLRLGCAVFVSPLHSPVHLAKSIATLDQLSRGRLEVGVGSGGRARMLSAFGVDPDSLVARFTEGIRLMKALWTEERVDVDGRFWQLSGAAAEPKRSSGRTRRCGWAAATPTRCAARSGTATASSAPGPAPPPRSPTRSGWPGRSWTGTAAPASASPSGCTSPSTTTPSAAGSASAPRCDGCTASSAYPT